ncbi:MAG: hypothetical protein BWX69_02836 [Planctomycetes bacterium ADurb.Bin069]|nr:MAG: hypothetical protein BWX69_02836 [Planctomycetes bacterium ADurb.Bin069]
MRRPRLGNAPLISQAQLAGRAGGVSPLEADPRPILPGSRTFHPRLPPPTLPPPRWAPAATAPRRLHAAHLARRSRCDRPPRLPPSPRPPSRSGRLGPQRRAGGALRACPWRPAHSPRPRRLRRRLPGPTPRHPGGPPVVSVPLRDRYSDNPCQGEHETPRQHAVDAFGAAGWIPGPGGRRSRLIAWRNGRPRRLVPGKPCDPLFHPSRFVSMDSPTGARNQRSVPRAGEGPFFSASVVSQDDASVLTQGAPGGDASTASPFGVRRWWRSWAWKRLKTCRRTRVVSRRFPTLFTRRTDRWRTGSFARLGLF